MSTACITLNQSVSFLEKCCYSIQKSSKVEKAALIAFGSLSAYYSLPVCLLGLSVYVIYKSSKALTAPLPYHPNDLRLPNNAAARLKKELSLAQEQAKAQKSRSFFSTSFASLASKPCDYEIHSETEVLVSAGIAHAQGMRPTMEDFHIATRGSSPVDYQLFAIIDGHGGTEVGRFVKDNLQQEIEAALKKHGLTNTGIRNALKEAFVRLDAKIPSEIRESCGAAAVVSLKIGNSLWTANLGDSRAVLKAGNKILQLSVDAKPDDLRFKRSIEKRGGWVERIFGVPRVNGVLACARAFGDKGLIGANGHYVISPRPKITKVDLDPLKGQPIYLIQACDGIWDVASSREASTLVGSGNLQKDASQILKAALNAGSTDNCSALVASI